MKVLSLSCFNKYFPPLNVVLPLLEIIIIIPLTTRLTFRIVIFTKEGKQFRCVSENTIHNIPILAITAQLISGYVQQIDVKHLAFLLKTYYKITNTY